MTGDKTEKSTTWHYLKAIIMLASIFIVWWFLSQSELGDNIRNYDWVELEIKKLGLYGPLLFICLGGISTVFGVPRLLVSAVAGFAFSILSALIIALLSTLLGCMISFYYARIMGRTIIRNNLSLRMKNFEKILIEHDFLASIGIRALPISNNSIVNLLAGVTGVRPLHYFAGSAIGYLPLTIVFVLVGSGIQHDLSGRILLSIALYLFIVIPLGYFVQKKLRLAQNTSEN